MSVLIRNITIKLNFFFSPPRPEELKQRTLACQMGLAKLMNVLSNSQDVVRNEVLLLLVYLTESDVSIQGFLVFDSGFEKRFAIIQAEGNSDGGIVVDDCIKLLLNLLKGNSSNKLMLLEGMSFKSIQFKQFSQFSVNFQRIVLRTSYHFSSQLRLAHGPFQKSLTCIPCSRYLPN